MFGHAQKYLVLFLCDYNYKGECVMKKFLSALLVALVAVVIVVPVSSVDAYSRGLLQGSPLTISTDYGVSHGTTDLVTDGLDWTYHDIEANGNYGAKSNLTYTFTSTSTITSYKLLAVNNPNFDHNTVSILFYDTNGNQIKEVTNPNGGGTINTLDTPINGVKKIALRQWSPYSQRVYEFDVFGREDISPPQTPTNLKATSGKGEIDLTWNTVTEVTYYNIKRSTTSWGPFTTVASSVYGQYTDSNVVAGATYYYVVSATNKAGESGNSNLVSAMVQAAQEDRAILVVTLMTGATKEYDLSNNELNSFLNWYEKRASGQGSSTYEIDKGRNVGPFLSRKDYLVFDKILTFEVNKYSAK